jgi:hypothetical protein
MGEIGPAADMTAEYSASQGRAAAAAPDRQAGTMAQFD